MMARITALGAGLALVLALALALSAALGACNESGAAADGRAAAAPPLDCAAFATRMSSCREEFWAAYAGTEMAKNNSSGPDTSRHVQEARAVYRGAAGDAQLCAAMADIFAGNPRWTPRVQACEQETSCNAWAACAAPALTSAARAP